MGYPKTIDVVKDPFAFNWTGETMRPIRMEIQPLVPNRSFFADL
ncbi:MAG TPA: hypothetical protein VK112_08755 [Fodinibius sp.]|nr:hypothetical protein [Fodinibius sp.]